MAMQKPARPFFDNGDATVVGVFTFERGQPKRDQSDPLCGQAIPPK